MAYEIVKELKCISNISGLTKGEIYESASSNSSIDAESFLVFNNEGDLGKYNRENFEITKTSTRDKTGWIIKCNDCCKEVTSWQLANNNNKCIRCGQKFIL